MTGPAANEDTVFLHLEDVQQACAEILLMDHTNPWELDAAVTEAGFACGICEAQDVHGLEHTLARRKITPATGRKISILNRMVSEGRLGRKTGVGWFRYPGGGGLVIDPLVEDLLREEARFAGPRRVELADAALVERIQLALINGAVSLLDANDPLIAPRIEKVARTRLGLPKAWGGILTLADHLGAGEICRRLDHLAQDGNCFWSVHPTLRRHAKLKIPLSPG